MLLVLAGCASGTKSFARSDLPRLTLRSLDAPAGLRYDPEGSGANMLERESYNPWGAVASKVFIYFCTASEPSCDFAAATKQQERAAIARVRRDPRVRRWRFVPKEKRLRQLRKTTPAAVKALPANPFPDALTIYPNYGGLAPTLGMELQAAKLPGVQKIDWSGIGALAKHLGKVLFLDRLLRPFGFVADYGTQFYGTRNKTAYAESIAFLFKDAQGASKALATMHSQIGQLLGQAAALKDVSARRLGQESWGVSGIFFASAPPGYLYVWRRRNLVLFFTASGAKTVMTEARARSWAAKLDARATG